MFGKIGRYVNRLPNTELDEQRADRPPIWVPFDTASGIAPDAFFDRLWATSVWLLEWKESLKPFDSSPILHLYTCSSLAQAPVCHYVRSMQSSCQTGV
jgi:hypothetical protein